MSTPSYIRAAGDPDYNFAYSDFTVEFFVSTNRSNGCQTLFEITNNESPAANLFTSTRFFSVIENGNLNAYAIQVTAPFYVSGNVSTFTSPVVIGSNDRLFYNGNFLQTDQYAVSGSTVTLSNVAIATQTTLVEVGQILFDVQGSQLSTNTMHFISAERFQNEFYLFLDGVSQSTPVPAFNAIPSQVISNTISGNSLTRFGSPALLTIGANKDGEDPLYGEFGDIKITNGVSRHVQQAQIQNVISGGLFTDANLGTQNSAIVIDGGGFVDSTSSYAPEEFVPGQIFDTLYLQVYQNEITFSNTVVSVDGHSVPYRTNANLNANYAFGGDNTGLNPTIVNVSPNVGISIQYLGGLWSISHPIGGSYGNTGNPYGSWDANGDPYAINPGIPFTPIAGNSAALVGGWANSTGQLVAPPFMVTNSYSGFVPAAATQLQLGMNDGSSLDDNSGSIDVAVIQQNANVSNVNLLSFALFKPTIMAGPTGSYSFTMPAAGKRVTLPWTSLDAASASVLVNGTPIESTQWAVANSVLTIVASPGDSVEIIATGPTTYYDVSNSSVSLLTSNVYANSSTINVANTDPFITPIIGSTANTSNNALLNVRGQIFINQECITYLYIDRTAKTLSGLMRGTSGTGVPNVHLANSRVISASHTNDLGNLAATDPRPFVWYAVPFSNTSLQDTNTAISTVLVNSGGLSPVTPF